jgi:hypothetical protein
VRHHISYEQLDRLDGELLPERIVLSVAGAGMAPGSGCQATYTPASPTVLGALGLVPEDPGSAGVSCGPGEVCQMAYYPGSQGLLGALGLGAQNPGAVITCVPART